MSAPTPLPPPVIRKRPRWPLLLAAAAVLSMLGFLVLGNANNNLVYYVLPSEYAAASERFEGRTLRLGGLATDVNYNRDTLALRFTVTDGQHSYPVRYTGAVPDMFREDAVVILEGRMEGETFQGQSLLVKHSEEYRVADGEAGGYDEGDLRRILDGDTL